MIRSVLASRRSLGGPLASVGGGGGGLPPVLTGLQFWIDGSDVSTLFQDTALTVPVTADGQAVRGQRDKSGNDYHVAEATNAPIYKTTILGGRSIVRFNGTALLSHIGPSLSQPTTIFVVGKSQNAAGVAGNFIDGNTDAGSGRHIVGAQTSNRWRIFGGSVVHGSSRDTDFHVFAATINGGSSSLYIDGSLILSGNAGGDAFDMIRIGTTNSGSSTQALDGDIGEILIYSGALSSADRLAMEAYLIGKWGF